MNKPATLYYIHDPMCSWCWAFRPVLAQLEQALSQQVDIVYVLGGLAEDSQEPMPKALQQTIKGHWQHIEATVGSEFNYDFWEKNTPRRSTFPACRAVLAARQQGQSKAMILAIQKAYYLRAMNPSDDDTLLQLADELGMDFDKFMHDFYSDEIKQAFQQERDFCQALQVKGFPSLRLRVAERYYEIAIDYQNAHSVLAAISQYQKLKQ